MEPQLTLRRLEIFRLIVDKRSVTRAAAQLMIAQPAVSSQLRSLEEWAGAKLFVRRGNQLFLTEAGRRVDAWAKRVLASATEVRRDVEGTESGQSGSVVVAASMGVGSYLLPRVLTRFRERNPGADITLNIVPPQETLRQIETGEADFAVTSWDSDELLPDVRSEVLRDEPLVLVVRYDKRPPGGTLHLDDALRLPLVGAPRAVAAQRSLTAQLRRISDVEPEYVISLGHALSTTRAVIEHGWAAILPRYAVEQEVAAADLAIVNIPGFDVRERLALVWHPEKIFSKLHERLMSATRHELGTVEDTRPATYW